MKIKILIGGGLLLIAAALFLTMNNMVESWRAGKTASGMLIQIERLESTRAELHGRRCGAREYRLFYIICFTQFF